MENQWEVDLLSEELLGAHVDILLAAAMAAPSTHNTQPWRVEVDGDLINIHLAGMLLGSVTQTVLHHGDCTVATIPAAAIGG